MNMIYQNTPNNKPFRLVHLLPSEPESIERVMIFSTMMLGSLVRSFWGDGLAYINEPSLGFDFGPPMALIVRIFICLVVAVIAYTRTHNQVHRIRDKKWLVYMIAFSFGYGMMMVLGLL